MPMPGMRAGKPVRKRPKRLKKKTNVVEQIIFYILTAIAIGSAAYVVLSQQLVHNYMETRQVRFLRYSK